MCYFTWIASCLNEKKWNISKIPFARRKRPAERPCRSSGFKRFLRYPPVNNRSVVRIVFYAEHFSMPSTAKFTIKCLSQNIRKRRLLPVKGVLLPNMSLDIHKSPRVCIEPLNGFALVHGESRQLDEPTAPFAPVEKRYDRENNIPRFSAS